MDINDVVIHVNETLDAQARHDLEESLRSINGVIVPRFNDCRTHFLVMAYNPDLTRSGVLLDAINRQSYTAQSCGGI